MESVTRGSPTTVPLAHVQNTGRDRFRFHRLDEHLRSVEQRAGDFADKFGAGDFGRLAGLWHDLGKFQPAFQSYIRRDSGFDPEAHLEGSVPGRVDHSTVGALHAVAELGKNGDRGAAIGRLLAYVIAGHHAGLPDWRQADGGAGSLQVRLRKRGEHLRATTKVPAALPFLAGKTPQGGPRSPTSLSLWVRLLFSALVDADFLDTEAFMDPGRVRSRAGWKDLPEIAEAFERFMETKVRDDTEVNRIRGEILSWCRDAAGHEPGLFSLTVPTGGGKTLSSMAFALRHALRHEMGRIVYVIPYTSILEQTVDVFREALGEGDPWTVVLEHHSNLDPDRESLRGRLAAENWDAPIVVTTSVQFFESLFAARSSRTRKLHNLVGSVVVLDEVQLINADFLHPILDVLQFLVDGFGVTVLLMTATRPSWSAADAGGPRLRGVREIVPDPDSLHERLRRVRVRIPRRLEEPEEWDEVADRILAEPSALCVVNSRQDARELFLRVRQEDPAAVHLSALMCGAHRSDVIRDVKERLDRGAGVRVVSTQLVEAGVDLDFPVVFRALAGLDSIAQTAGRCNREGRSDHGEVHVFVPPTSPPPGILRQASDVTRSLYAEGELDPLSPAAFNRFFRHLYWLRGDLDKEGIRRLLDHDGRSEGLEYAFRTAGSRFRLIDDRDRVSIVVRWPGPGGDPRVESALRDLEYGGGWRGVFRRLQRAVVGVSRRHLLPLEAVGAVEELHDRLYVQRDTSLYDDVLGLAVSLETARNPEDLIG
ncbi:MAG: CRISPR-associated helicase Cas3' [Gammaproteobacteria bacterium]|nr:CRISPR-associated helicase Cas3' [Gammaproteobacteria bacterium]